MPDRMPDRMSEQMPARMSEYIYIYICAIYIYMPYIYMPYILPDGMSEWCVRVGITRRKSNFIYLQLFSTERLSIKMLHR